MAVSKITLNHANIASHFQAAPLRGTGITGGRGGVGRGEARALAEKMALQARINAATRFHQRTTALVQSVIPIVREGQGGSVEVGVGTTVEQGKWLEIGTDPHFIDAPPFPKALLWDSGSKGPVPDEWKLRGAFKRLPHPGNEAHHWMSDAVRSVVPGSIVRVRLPRG